MRWALMYLGVPVASSVGLAALHASAAGAHDNRMRVGGSNPRKETCGWCGRGFTGVFGYRQGYALSRTYGR